MISFSKIFPKGIRKEYEHNVRNAGIADFEKYIGFVMISSLMFAIIVSLISLFAKFSILIAFPSAFLLAQIFFYFKVSLLSAARIKKMESAFPDMIQLMASNLRAGMTIDKAFLLSARPEFYPLNEEVLRAGKEITTGKDISSALISMNKRINSDKISRTILLIITGLKAGGNISVLLEQTAANMRDKEFIEKRTTSIILMYVMFIFIAAGVGAPLLFGLSSVITEILINFVKNMPVMESAHASLPFSFRDIGIPSSFILYFSLLFLISTNIMSCLVIGLVNTGEQKSGLKYLIPMIIISIAVFFIIRIVLLNFLVESFSISR